MPQEIAEREHPRACGEYERYAIAIAADPGTPPRVRGVQESPKEAHPRLGNTPARAGSTSWQRPPVRPSWEHPRACGEYRRVI